MLDYGKGVALGGLNIKSGSLYLGSKNNGVQTKLANSVLRISGTESAAGSSSKEAAAAKDTLSNNFAKSLLSNLVIANNLLDAKNKHSDEENEALVDSVVSVVEEVKEEFGDVEANHLMAKILLNTEGGVTENRITAAIGEFFVSVRNSAYEKLNGSGKTQETVDEANLILKKLGDMAEFLNEGDPGAAADANGKKAVSSLSDALNGYFAPERQLDADKKVFTANFDFVKASEAEALNASASGAVGAREFYLTKAELGADAVAAAVNYLSEVLGEEEAAAVIENLEEDEDILKAVEETRNYLSSLDTLASTQAGIESAAEAGAVAAAKTGEEEDTLSKAEETKAGIAAARLVTEVAENSSKIALFDNFLNTTLVGSLNEVAKEDEAVGTRLRTLVSSKVGFEVSALSAVAFGGWPGTGTVSVAGVSVSLGYEKTHTLSVNENNEIEAVESESFTISASFVNGTVSGLG
ncbi:MAG: hypothetical protein LBF41_00800, partial [Deltaproteobacteria bacterium]|nr:hypothetical protein [Deltaproteobacteria bacterium]